MASADFHVASSQSPDQERKGTFDQDDMDEIDNDDVVTTATTNDTKSITSTDTFSMSDDEEPPPTTIKEKAFRILDDPSYNTASKIWGVIIMVCLFTSIITFLIGTLPSFWIDNGTPMIVIDWITIVIFTIDYFARLIFSPNPLRFIIQPLNIVDLVSFLPFYIEVILSAAAGVETKTASLLRVVRIIRFARVLRLAKLNKYSSSIQIISLTFRKSREGFVMLFALIGTALILFSTMIFYAEQTLQYFDETKAAWIRLGDGSLSPYQSIFHSMWWCIITMTTVGYGDQFPVTPLGKFVAALTAISGVLVLAFPIAIFANNFNLAYAIVTEKIKQRKLKAKMKRLMKKNKERGETITPDVNEAASTMSAADALKKLDVLYIEMKNAIENANKTVSDVQGKHDELSQIIPALRKMATTATLKSKKSTDNPSDLRSANSKESVSKADLLAAPVPTPAPKSTKSIESVDKDLEKGEKNSIEMKDLPNEASDN